MTEWDSDGDSNSISSTTIVNTSLQGHEFTRSVGRGSGFQQMTNKPATSAFHQEDC